MHRGARWARSSRATDEEVRPSGATGDAARAPPASRAWLLGAVGCDVCGRPEPGAGAQLRGHLRRPQGPGGRPRAPRPQRSRTCSTPTRPLRRRRLGDRASWGERRLSLGAPAPMRRRRAGPLVRGRHQRDGGTPDPEIYLGVRADERIELQPTAEVFDSGRPYLAETRPRVERRGDRPRGRRCWRTSPTATRIPMGPLCEGLPARRSCGGKPRCCARWGGVCLIVGGDIDSV